MMGPSHKILNKYDHQSQLMRPKDIIMRHGKTEQALRQIVDQNRGAQ